MADLLFRLGYLSDREEILPSAFERGLVRQTASGEVYWNRRIYYRLCWQGTPLTTEEPNRALSTDRRHC